MSSNFKEGENLTEKVERKVAEGELKDVEVFVYTNNLVFEIFF